MERDQISDEIASLALGVTVADDARRLRARISLSDELLAEYQADRATADLVGFAAEAPPDALHELQRTRMKSKIMNVVRPTQPTASRASAERATWPAYVIAVAALAAAFLAVSQITVLRNALSGERQRIAALEQRLGAESRTAAEQRAKLADLFAPDSRHYPVAGGEVITHDGRVYIAMRSLPKLPPGKVFQVWTLARGAKTVAPSVTFAPNGAGSAIVELPPQRRALAAVALSVEPHGGSKAPTTKPTFIRPLS